MFSFDLKKGYHHIDIFSEHTQYLSFAWDFGGGVVRYFSFQVLPFGLSSVPYIFTKCIRPLVKHWRERGHFIVVFSDDGWCISHSYDQCKVIANAVKNDLISAGLVPNVEKSVWEPTQNIDWFGMTQDSQFGTLKIIDTRILNIFECIDRILMNLPSLSARQLASFVGKIISLKPVSGYICQLKTRFSSRLICDQIHWDKVFKLNSNSPVVEEIFFWKDNLRSLSCTYVFDYLVPQILCYSDASSSGCGALAH